MCSGVCILRRAPTWNECQSTWNVLPDSLDVKTVHSEKYMISYAYHTPRTLLLRALIHTSTQARTVHSRYVAFLYSTLNQSPLSRPPPLRSPLFPPPPLPSPSISHQCKSYAVSNRPVRDLRNCIIRGKGKGWG